MIYIYIILFVTGLINDTMNLNSCYLKLNIINHTFVYTIYYIL